MATYQVERYALRIYSPRPNPSLAPNQMVAEVYCYDATTFRGYIRFLSDCTPLPPAVHDTNNGRIILYVHLSQFAATSEILRTEKPLYLFYSNPNYAGLRSGVEPTGEEETE